MRRPLCARTLPQLLSLCLDKECILAKVRTMARVTSKLQVKIPKAVASRYGICPGDEIAWMEAGDSIRVIPAGLAESGESPAERLRVFDQATLRQRARQGGRTRRQRAKERGWKREELYDRGRPD